MLAGRRLARSAACLSAAVSDCPCHRLRLPAPAAFLDADEFLVLQGGGAQDAPALLRRYEAYAGLALNWVMFGSSGHEGRPEGGVLANYVSCMPAAHPAHHHVKSIVDPRRVVKPGTPHHFEYEEGAYAGEGVEMVGGAVGWARQQGFMAGQRTLSLPCF